MKPIDYSKNENVESQPTDNKKLIGRREVISKAGLYALSAATMMVLMKSQPAMAASTTPAPPLPTPQSSDQTWKRTNRS